MHGWLYYINANCSVMPITILPRPRRCGCRRPACMPYGLWLWVCRPVIIIIIAKCFPKSHCLLLDAYARCLLVWNCFALCHFDNRACNLALCCYLHSLPTCRMTPPFKNEILFCGIRSVATPRYPVLALTSSLQMCDPSAILDPRPCVFVF